MRKNPQQTDVIREVHVIEPGKPFILPPGTESFELVTFAEAVDDDGYWARTRRELDSILADMESDAAIEEARGAMVKRQAAEWAELRGLTLAAARSGSATAATACRYGSEALEVVHRGELATIQPTPDGARCADPRAVDPFGLIGSR